MTKFLSVCSSYLSLQETIFVEQLFVHILSYKFELEFRIVCALTYHVQLYL